MQFVNPIVTVCRLTVLSYVVCFSCVGCSSNPELWIDLRPAAESGEQPPRPQPNRCADKIEGLELPQMRQIQAEPSEVGAQYTGQGSVDESGVFHYMLPINVVPGAAGMTPQLSLKYSSEGGLSYGGQGMTLMEALGGLGSIRRCAKRYGYGESNAPVSSVAIERGEIEEGHVDALCFGHVRLIETSQGKYVRQGDPRSVFWEKQRADGGRYFVSYQPGAGGAGLIIRYGAETQSRIGGVHGVARGQEDNPYIFAADTVSDLRGNAMKVRYIGSYGFDARAGDRGWERSAEYYPEQIGYGGKVNVQVEYGDGTEEVLGMNIGDGWDVFPKTVVRFEWEDLEEMQRGFVGRQRTASSQRLAAVVSLLRESAEEREANENNNGEGAADGMRERIRTVFSYGAGSLQDRVVSAHQCVRADFSEEWQCSAEERLVWSVAEEEPQSAFSEPFSMDWNMGWLREFQSEDDARGPSEADHPVYFADLNGDGYPDMYYPKPSEDVWFVSLNDGRGRFLPEQETNHRLLDFGINNRELYWPGWAVYDGCSNGRTEICNVPTWPTRAVNLNGYSPSRVIALGQGQWLDADDAMVELRWEGGDFIERVMDLAHGVGQEDPSQNEPVGVSYGPAQTGRWSPGNLIDFNGDGQLELLSFYRAYGQRNREELGPRFGNIESIRMRALLRSDDEEGQVRFGDEERIFLDESRADFFSGELRYRAKYYEVGLGDLDGASGQDVVLYYPDWVEGMQEQSEMRFYIGAYISEEAGQIRRTAIKGLSPEQWLTGIEISRNDEGGAGLALKGWNTGKKAMHANRDGMTDFLVWHHAIEDGDTHGLDVIVNRGEGAFFERNHVSGDVLELYGRLLEDPSRREHAMKLSFQEGRVVDLDLDGRSEFVYPCEQPAQLQLHDVIGDGGLSEEDAARIDELQQQGAFSPIGQLCVLWWEGEEPRIELTTIPYSRHESNPEIDYAWSAEAEWMSERSQVLHMMSFVDVDMDGDLDLIYRHENDTPVSVYENLHQKIELVGRSHQRPDGQWHETLRVEYEPLSSARSGFYEAASSSGQRADEGFSKPYVSISKSGHRIVSALAQYIGVDEQGQSEWSQTTYRYGTFDYDVLNQRMIGPRWRETIHTQTGQMTRHTYGYNHSYVEERHAFVFAGIPSEVDFFAKTTAQGGTYRLIRHVSRNAPIHHAVNMEAERGDWVELGDQQTLSFAIDGSTRPVRQAWQEVQDAEAAQAQGNYQVVQGALLQKTLEQVGYDEIGRVLSQVRWVDDPAVMGTVVGAGESWNRKEQSTLNYTEGSWGEWGQVLSIHTQLVGGDSEELIEKSKSTQRDFIYDENNPWILRSIRYDDVEGVPADEKRIETFEYDDEEDSAGQRTVRGHVVRVIEKNGYPEENLLFEAREHRVVYDAEGFAPECIIKEASEDIVLISTQQMDRSLGKVKRSRDPNGVKNEVWYDGFGRPYAIADDAGAGQIIQYGSEGELWTVSWNSVTGQTKIKKYDDVGRVHEQVKNEFGGQGEGSKWIKVVHRHKVRDWASAFNHQGVLAIHERFGPFEVGAHEVDTHDHALNHNEMMYEKRETDRWGRLVRVTSSGLGPATFEYDYNQDSGLVQSTLTDSAGYQWKSLTDGLGRTVERVEPEVLHADIAMQEIRHVQCKLSYRYNVLSQPIEIDVCGQQTTMGYDRLGRISWSHHPDSAGTMVRQYNAFSDLIQTVDAAGVRVNYAYDRLGRKVGERRYAQENGQEHLNETRVFDYDRGPYALGKLVRASNSNTVKEYGYDATGHLSAWVSNLNTLDGRDEQYRFDLAYDGFGRLVQKHYPKVSPTDLRLIESYRYDVASGSISQIFAGWSEDLPLTEVWRLEQLDTQGQVAFSMFGNGLENHSRYSASTGQLMMHGVGRPEDFEQDRFVPSIQHHTFVRDSGEIGYDARGLLNFDRDEILTRDTLYTYDSLGRLTESGTRQSAQLSAERMQYDVWGNLVQKATKPFADDAEAWGLGENQWRIQQYDYRRGDEEFGPNAATAMRTYATDDIPEVGREFAVQVDLIEPEQRFLYTEEGHLKNFRGQSFHYGTNGAQPERVVHEEEGIVHGYLYDAFGKRVQKRVHREQGMEVGEAELDLVYLEGMVHEKHVNGSIEVKFFTMTPDNTTVMHRVVLDEENETEFAVRYLHRNRLGTIEALTDAQGNLLGGQGSPEELGAWGQVPVNQRSAQDRLDHAQTQMSELGFTGHVKETELGLVNMGARQYSPELGRFISADGVIPDLSFSQAFNRYAYGYNNPINFVDPNGQSPIPIMGAVPLIPPLWVAAKAIAAWGAGMLATESAVAGAVTVGVIGGAAVSTQGSERVEPFPVPITASPRGPGDGVSNQRRRKDDDGKGDSSKPPERSGIRPIALIDPSRKAWFQIAEVAMIEAARSLVVPDGMSRPDIPFPLPFVRDEGDGTGMGIPFSHISSGSFDGTFDAAFVVNPEPSEDRIKGNLTAALRVIEGKGTVLFFSPVPLRDLHAMFTGTSSDTGGLALSSEIVQGIQRTLPGGHQIDTRYAMVADHEDLTYALQQSGGANLSSVVFCRGEFGECPTLPYALIVLPMKSPYSTLETP